MVTSVDMDQFNFDTYNIWGKFAQHLIASMREDSGFLIRNNKKYRNYAIQQKQKNHV